MPQRASLSYTLTMYHTDYFPLLKLHLRVCKFLKCIPFEYNEKLGIIIRTRNVQHIRMFKWQSILSLLYTFATFLHVFFGGLTLIEKFQESLFLIMDILVTAMRWNYSLDPSPGQIINAFINFEKQILRGPICIVK